MTLPWCAEYISRTSVYRTLGSGRNYQFQNFHYKYQPSGAEGTRALSAASLRNQNSCHVVSKLVLRCVYWTIQTTYKYLVF